MAESGQSEEQDAVVTTETAPPGDRSAAPQGRERRRSRWASTWAAAQYLNKLPRKEFRDTDRTTNWLVIASIVALGVLMFVPFDETRAQMAVGCVVLFSTTLLFFIANRFGIISTLTPRQAVLVWDLLIGVSLLSVFIAICVQAAITHLRISVGGI